MRSFGATFAAAVASRNAEYFITAVFHFINARGDVYISDRPVTDGDGHVHNPVIPLNGWGDFESVLPRDFRTLDFKSQQVKFINYPVDAQSPGFIGERFSDLLKAETAACEVDLYHTVRVNGVVYKEKFTTLIVQGPNNRSFQQGAITLRSLFEKYFNKNFLRAVTKKEYPYLRDIDEGALIPHVWGDLPKISKGIVVDKVRGVVVFSESPAQGPIQSINKVFADGYELSASPIRKETTSLSSQHIFAIDNNSFDGSIGTNFGGGSNSGTVVINNGTNNSITQPIKIPLEMRNPRITHMNFNLYDLQARYPAAAWCLIKIKTSPPGFNTSGPPDQSQFPGSTNYDTELLNRWVFVAPGASIDTDNVPVVPGGTYYVSIMAAAFTSNNASTGDRIEVQLVNTVGNNGYKGISAGDAILQSGINFAPIAGKSIYGEVGIIGDPVNMAAYPSGPAFNIINGDKFATSTADQQMTKSRGLLSVAFDLKKARLAVELLTYNWGIAGVGVSINDGVDIHLTTGASPGGEPIEIFHVNQSDMGTAITQSALIGSRIPVRSPFSKMRLLPPGRYWLTWYGEDVSTQGASQPDSRFTMATGVGSTGLPTDSFDEGDSTETIFSATRAGYLQASVLPAPGDPYFEIDFGINVCSVAKYLQVPDVPIILDLQGPWPRSNVAHYVDDQNLETDDVALVDLGNGTVGLTVPEEIVFTAELIGSKPYGGLTPDRFIQLVTHRSGVSDSRIDIAGSFAAARAFYESAPGPYEFDGIQRDQIKIKELLIKLVFECRSILDWNVDLLKLKVLPNPPGSSVGNVAPFDIIADGYIPRLVATQPDPNDPDIASSIINSIEAKYYRDWQELSSVKYLITLPEVFDRNSINIYGKRNNEIFESYDWIISEDMIKDVVGYYLSRKIVPKETVELTVKLPFLKYETDDQLAFLGV